MRPRSSQYIWTHFPWIAEQRGLFAEFGVTSAELIVFRERRILWSLAYHGSDNEGSSHKFTILPFQRQQKHKKPTQDVFCKN